MLDVVESREKRGSDGTGEAESATWSLFNRRASPLGSALGRHPPAPYRLPVSSFPPGATLACLRRLRPVLPSSSILLFQTTPFLPLSLQISTILRLTNQGPPFLHHDADNASVRICLLGLSCSDGLKYPLTSMNVLRTGPCIQNSKTSAMLSRVSPTRRTYWMGSVDVKINPPQQGAAHSSLHLRIRPHTKDAEGQLDFARIPRLSMESNMHERHQEIPEIEQQPAFPFTQSRIKIRDPPLSELFAPDGSNKPWPAAGLAPASPTFPLHFSSSCFTVTVEYHRTDLQYAIRIPLRTVVLRIGAWPEPFPYIV